MNHGGFLALQKNNKGEKKLTVPQKTGWSDDISLTPPRMHKIRKSSAHSSVCLPTFKEGFLFKRGLKSLQAVSKTKKLFLREVIGLCKFPPLTRMDCIVSVLSNCWEVIFLSTRVRVLPGSRVASKDRFLPRNTQKSRNNTSSKVGWRGDQMHGLQNFKALCYLGFAQKWLFDSEIYTCKKPESNTYVECGLVMISMISMICNCI